MKFGVRKPSLKRSIKAKTTGRVKRTLKSAVNPTYGKKGVGFINNPKKSIYNKLYNNTSVSISDIASSPKNSTYSDEQYSTGIQIASIIVFIGIVVFFIVLIKSFLGLFHIW